MIDEAEGAVQGALCGPREITLLRALLDAVEGASEQSYERPVKCSDGTTIMARTCDADEAREAVMAAFEDDTLRRLLDTIEYLRAKASDVVRTAGLVAMGDLGQPDLDEAVASLAAVLHPRRAT